MAVEDSATLGKLFSRVRTLDQIEHLLEAYHDLRHPHKVAVLKHELWDIWFMSLPPSEMQERRDALMKANRDAGRDVVMANIQEVESREWNSIKGVFAYDPEEDVENWWHEWGLLRERARGTDVALGFVEPVTIHQDVSQEVSHP